MSPLPWLDHRDLQFPRAGKALTSPNGLLAAGGDLRPERLLLAYQSGIFPWYEDPQPILWWSPDPRLVLFPKDLHLGRSSRRLLRQHDFTVTYDRAFLRVIKQCAEIRADRSRTWITNDIISAYYALFVRGYGHSVEVWQSERLVGGLYGIALGDVFFGESMFSLVSGASKVGFATLVTDLLAWGFKLIDCQVETEYLRSFGAVNLPRDAYLDQLQRHCRQDLETCRWPKGSHTPGVSL